MYVLATDPRMPSKGNLWAHRQVAALKTPLLVSRHGFKSGIHPLIKGGQHLTLMDEDRARRLREDDFRVELA